MDEEERNYTSAQFHDDVIELFKRSAMRLSYERNPLDWEELPAKTIDLFYKLLSACIADQNYGPEVIDRGDTEATLGFYICLIDACDGESFSGKPISDILLKEARCRGFNPSTMREELEDLINGITKSIELAREKAKAAGWYLDTSPRPS